MTTEDFPARFGEDDFERIKALLEESRFVAHCGFELKGLEAGRCELNLPLQAVHANAYGSLHGGVVASLVDTASGVAAWTMAEGGERVSTVELKVNFIAGVSAMEGELKAVGLVLHKGRTTAVVEAEVTDGAGRLIARSLGTFFFLQTKGEEARGS